MDRTPASVAASLIGLGILVYLASLVFVVTLPALATSSSPVRGYTRRDP
jgi:hypothetical protein